PARCRPARTGCSGAAGVCPRGRSRGSPASATPARPGAGRPAESRTSWTDSRATVGSWDPHRGPNGRKRCQGPSAPSCRQGATLPLWWVTPDGPYQHRLRREHRMRIDFTPDPALYPFTSRWFDSSQGRLHYIDEGSGPVIMFFHGNPTWSFLYRDIITGLRD